MGETEDELREELLDVFERAEYPVANQMDLIPALPDGPGTTFEAGDVRFTAMELATKLSGQQDFPYDSAEELVDDIVAGLKAKGEL